MKIDAIALAKKFQRKFQEHQQNGRYSQIADVITCALQILPSEYNRQIFGYIPGIFRQVELHGGQLQSQDLFIGEPVVYRVHYSGEQTLYGMPYFYVFCYLKPNSSRLNVYFQSAYSGFKKLTQPEYQIEQAKINFEGCISAFNPDDISVISISDPGHFVPGFTSSYYLGSAELNFNRVIAKVLKNICDLANISLSDTLLFGSSAGTFGALLTSTYLQQKTHVLAVNSQIFLQYRGQLMKTCFGLNTPQQLLAEYGDRISCIRRFQQEIDSVPNIYILANLNDRLYQRNFDFYQLYVTKYSKKGVNNQSVFDSYYGVEGHGRPEPSSLKDKIKIARKILTMKSTFD